MKLLLVEDNAPDARLISEMLKESVVETFRLQQATRLDTALERLHQETFDLVLLDLGLPDSQGVETVTLMHQANPSVPIVVLTGLDDQFFALGAVRAGAQDYLVKGRFDADLLLRTIRYAVERKRAEGEIHRLNADLERRVAERTAQLQTLNDQLLKEIVERKAAEMALREAEERARLAAEAADLGTWEVDVATDALNWSRRARAIFGIADGAPLNHQVFLERLHPDDREHTLEARQRALDPAGDGGYETEYRVLWSDGTVRWVIATGRAFFDMVNGERRAVRFIGVMRDVTTRKLAELALRRSTERFQLLSTVTARLLTAENPQTVVNDLCAAVMKYLDCQMFFNFVAERTSTPVEAVSDRRADTGTPPDSRRSKTAARNAAAPDGHLRLNACAGISGEEARRIEWLDYGMTVCGCVAQGCRRIVAEDIQHTPDPRTELVKGYGIQAYACHPLMAGERLLGTLSFGTTRRTRFTDDDLALMKTVSDHVAVAMDRMQSAQALRRLNRTLHALSESDRAMMRATSEEKYLAEICRIIVEDCGYTMVWIGYAEEDEARSVRPTAWAGFEDGYLETLRVTWADTERGRGPTGTAIRTGQPCVCGDMLTDPKFAPWRGEAVKRGYASSVALPLTADARTFGAITIYSREPAAFLKDEVVLLGQLADDLGHGIHVLRLRKAREKLEQDVCQSEAQFRALFDLAAVGMVEVELTTGRLLRVNGKFCEITGYSHSELTGKPFAMIIHPDEREAEAKLFQRFARSETRDYRNERRFVRKDGSIVWVFANISAIRDSAGRPWRAVAAIDDISDRKAAEQALRRAKEEWERTFDSVPDLVAILDGQHRIVRANRAMAKRLGVKPEQCVGQICYRFVHDSKKPHTACPHLMTLADGEEHVAEISESRLGGDFLVSTTPFFDDNKNLLGVVHVARDITARKRLESQLRGANAVLEHRVAARTAELKEANRRLLQEVEERNRANRALRVLSETNEALIRPTDETAFLKRACEILVSSGSYRLAWIGFAEQDDKQSIRSVAKAGFEPGWLQAVQSSLADIPQNQRAGSMALRTGKIVVCRDLANDRRFHRWKTLSARFGVGSAIILPLKLDHRQMAVLAIGATEANAFDAGEVKLLTELADDIVYAIGSLHARLERQQLQEEVITISEAERRRVGQELHDGLSSQLVAARFAGEMLHKKLNQASSPHASQAAEITEVLGATVDQARNLSLMLNPVAVEVEGLMAALEKLVSDSRRLFHQRVQFVCPQPVLIADNTLATHLYRIAQEAVRNAFTHGQATRATIGLRESRGYIKLSVVNNGRPFPEVVAKHTGMGLKNMRHRAETIGAQLDIRPRPRGGTTVICKLPAGRPAARRTHS